MTIKCTVTRVLAALLVGSMGLAFNLPARADMVKDLGRNAAWRSISGLPISLASTPLGQVTIQKGKKKKVLEVEATLIEISNVATGLAVQASVNGVPMEPTPASSQGKEGCSAAIVNCTTQGAWWIDLDQAELLFPGVFIGVPLTVTISGNSTGSATTGHLSIRARLGKP